MITGCHHRRVPGDDVFAGDPELKENEHLTPAQKAKRALARRDFTAEIEELYR